MSLTVTVAETGTRETYFTSDAWETKVLKTELQRALSKKEPETTVTIYAKLEGIGVNEVQEVVKWSLSDLYAYSQPPQIDLVNFFGSLLDQCNLISEDDLLEFEVQTVNFWNKARELSKFFGMSDTYDELLSMFQILSVGYNGILDSEKLRALKIVLDRVRDVINLTDEVLDDLLDTLSHGGFDLKAPMTFTADPP